MRHRQRATTLPACLCCPCSWALDTLTGSIHANTHPTAVARACIERSASPSIGAMRSSGATAASGAIAHLAMLSGPGGCSRHLEGAGTFDLWVVLAIVGAAGSCGCCAVCTHLSPCQPATALCPLASPLPCPALLPAVFPPAQTVPGRCTHPALLPWLAQPGLPTSPTPSLRPPT